MFRLIPLRSIARTTQHRVDLAGVDLGWTTVQREIFAPNGTSPAYDDLPRSWNMMPNKTNAVLVTAGTLELTVYSLQARKQDSLVLTPENVYLNGKVHYGSPAMLEWAPGVFYKMRADDDGCTFVTFTADRPTEEVAAESSAV